ncbi:hypothetical protein WUBG_04265 [Wuchereria bancrofti]|uniref:Uncharacterized protein n=1 Tax=Wuchereria bancrofti TaxID=6293 RepID=J9FBT8_WUCBA|nr:hypothetical protein WUBG_04265 [Wuchereria bancrofti]
MRQHSLGSDPPKDNSRNHPFQLEITKRLDQIESPTHSSDCNDKMKGDNVMLERISDENDKVEKSGNREEKTHGKCAGKAIPKSGDDCHPEDWTDMTDASTFIEVMLTDLHVTSFPRNDIKTIIGLEDPILETGQSIVEIDQRDEWTSDNYTSFTILDHLFSKNQFQK